MKKGLSILGMAVVTLALAWAALIVISTPRVATSTLDPTGEFDRREAANDASRNLHLLAEKVIRQAGEPKGKLSGPFLASGGNPAIVNILNQPSGAIQPLPADVENFLQERRPDIDQLREALRTGPTPQWARDDAALEKGPLPNLLEQMRTARILTADALSAGSRGDNERAWQTLEAQWVLARALWRRPEVISNLIALASTKMINATARKLPAPAPSWWREFESFDVDGHFQRTLAFEKWSLSRRVREQGRDAKPMEQLGHLLIRPVERLQLSRTLPRYDEVARIPLDCRNSPPPAAGSPFFTWLGGGTWTDGLTETRRRFARFILEREMSSKVLVVRDARRTGHPVPDVSSSRCGSWQIGSEGGMTALRHLGAVPRTAAPVPPMPLEMSF